MDYINYSDKIHQSFPVVAATPLAPSTLYHAATGIVYVNTGSGWQPGVQPESNSVYAAVSGASAAVKAAVVASISSTVSSPSAAHATVATKVVNVINNKH